MNNSKINYLVGKKISLERIVKPFSVEVINFLNDFSRKINLRKDSKDFPDIKGLAFFCRKQNILNNQNLL